YFAGSPHVAGVSKLEEVWRRLRRRDVFPVTFRSVLGFMGGVTATLSTLAGAATFLLYARAGPIPFAKAIFDPRQIGAVFCHRPLMYATAGYLGHMWELYAMWTWLLTFNRAALKA